MTVQSLCHTAGGPPPAAGPRPRSRRTRRPCALSRRTQAQHAHRLAHPPRRLHRAGSDPAHLRHHLPTHRPPPRPRRRPPGAPVGRPAAVDRPAPHRRLGTAVRGERLRDPGPPRLRPNPLRPDQPAPRQPRRHHPANSAGSRDPRRPGQRRTAQRAPTRPSASAATAAGWRPCPPTATSMSSRCSTAASTSTTASTRSALHHPARPVALGPQEEGDDRRVTDLPPPVEALTRKYGCRRFGAAYRYRRIAALMRGGSWVGSFGDLWSANGPVGTPLDARL